MDRKIEKIRQCINRQFYLFVVVLSYLILKTNIFHYDKLKLEPDTIDEYRAALNDRQLENFHENNLTRVAK